MLKRRIFDNNKKKLFKKIRATLNTSYDKYFIQYKHIKTENILEVN